MTLWTKESNANDALYVDIFDSKPSDLTFCVQNYEAIQMQIGVTEEKKRDAVSLAYRKNGNALFSEGKWVPAMEKYNDSLRFAKNGSPNISLALGNRSACFLHLKMYQECLVDIESAKRFLFPENLMWKLDQRKQDCLKAIEDTVQGPNDDIGRKLSFEADGNFPCMANVLQFNIEDNGNFSVVATDDIGAGHTIVIESPFISYLYMHYGHKCNICLKERSNLRPCSVCTIAMFCSDECESHHLHKLECNLKFCDRKQFNGQILEGARLIFSIIEQFASATELIAFVEREISNDRKELPVALTDFQSKYRLFLKRSVNTEFAKSDNCLLMTYCTYTFALTVPRVKEWFSSVKYRRFLGHLIGQHVRILEENTTKIRYMDKQTDALSYMGLMDQFFEHSCAPNVLNCVYNGSSCFVTIRPIKKGERLQISYVEPLQSKAQRQRELLQRFRINCNCVRCIGTSLVTPAQQQQINSDPDFKAIVDVNVADLYDSVPNKAQNLIEKCAALLEKYDGMAWCTELQQILEVFIRVLRIRFASPLSYTLEELVFNRLKQTTQKFCVQ